MQATKASLLLPRNRYKKGAKTQPYHNVPYLQLGEEGWVRVQEDDRGRRQSQLFEHPGAGGVRAVPREQFGHLFCSADVFGRAYARLLIPGGCDAKAIWGGGGRKSTKHATKKQVYLRLRQGLG